MLLFLSLNYSFFFIPAVITQIFKLIPALVIPTAIQTKEAKAEMETHPVTVETKTSQRSI